MISLHDFDKAIRFIEERDKGVEKVNKVFTEEFEDSVFYPYFKYEAAFVDLLVAAVSDNYDAREDIECFLYELDYGHNWEPGMITEAGGTDVKMSSTEDLYNYIVENNKKNAQ